MSKDKKSDFGTIDYLHYGYLIDCGYKIKEADYLFLEQVGNMQKDPKRGFWCTMDNEAFCKKKRMTDSGIRTMQKKLVKMGLLVKQEGTKTGKRCTSLFFNPVPLEGSILFTSSESSDSQKVTKSPSESDEVVRQKVTKSPSESDDKRKEKVNTKEKVNKKESIYLPFSSSSFKEMWENWVTHRKEKKSPLTATSIKMQFKKFEKIGEERAISMMLHTIEKGWTGLREEEKSGQNNNKQIAQQKGKGYARFSKMVMPDYD